MSIERANGFLEAIALINEGTDHHTCYELTRLPTSDSVVGALRQHFGTFTDELRPPQNPDLWHIKNRPLPAEWQPLISEECRRWFFDRGYSPRSEPGWVKDNIVNKFMFTLAQAVGICTVYDVTVTPPGFWYATTWADYAFDAGTEYYLLHFDFSD